MLTVRIEPHGIRSALDTGAGPVPVGRPPLDAPRWTHLFWCALDSKIVSSLLLIQFAFFISRHTHTSFLAHALVLAHTPTTQPLSHTLSQHPLSHPLSYPLSHPHPLSRTHACTRTRTPKFTFFFFSHTSHSLPPKPGRTCYRLE